MNTYDETGIEELRALVSLAGYTTESVFDDFTALETLRLLQACRALDLEVMPDMLTSSERKAIACTGKVSTKCLRRLYKAAGFDEIGRDWEGR